MVWAGYGYAGLGDLMAHPFQGLGSDFGDEFGDEVEATELRRAPRLNVLITAIGVSLLLGLLALVLAISRRKRD